MDRIDAKILTQLQTDGRVSWSQLATLVNLSASACQRRVESLQDRGVIQNFTINLNEATLGNRVKAFVEVNVDRQNTALAEEFRQAVRRIPQIQSCYMISGRIDFILEVVATDLSAFGNFIENELLALPAVKDVSSSFVLKPVKSPQTMIA